MYWKEYKIVILDDIKNNRLKRLKPKKGTFVKREDIPAGNLSYSVSNNLHSKPSNYIKYYVILPNGHPRFKRKEDYHSFTYRQHNNVWKLTSRVLFLSKITEKDDAIDIDINYNLLNGHLKTCTIKKKGKQWFAFITIELPDYPEPIIPKTMVDQIEHLIVNIATLC